MSKDMNFHVHFMKREIEEYRKTPVRYDCDVVVCGGGTAGFTAGLAAARNGADTILVERFGHVGGTLVNGAGPLHSFFNLYKACLLYTSFRRIMWMFISCMSRMRIGRTEPRYWRR